MFPVDRLMFMWYLYSSAKEAALSNVADYVCITCRHPLMTHAKADNQ
jgi:hypothetical protein